MEHFEGKTEEFSILNLSAEKHDADGIASFFQDLNLLQVIDKLAKKWGKDVRKLYLYVPATQEEEAYRRAVYGDIKQDAVYQALMTFISKLAEVETLREAGEKVQAHIQKAVWTVREVGAYCSAYDELVRELEQAELTSQGMQRFTRILRGIMDSDYGKILEKTQALIKQMRELRFVITYDKDRISVALGTIPGEGQYSEMLKSKGGKGVKPFLNPFRTEPSLTELERACLEILIDKNEDFFRDLKNTADSIADYEKSVLKRFEQEIIFYLSFRTLTYDMEKAGFRFATPEPPGMRRMEAEGLYDLALALTLLDTGKEVVPNDFYYDEGESFFVLTGPNQGGKTTFARSLGQLVYFTKMGLDVPARSAKVPHFPDIQTHFSVEESVETGRGKLKEELIRLAPMMDEFKKGTFVIINELFTTAATYDAQIMGKKVLSHFIGLDCMGIYVTHLKELAEVKGGVVSLRAMLDDRRVQTFRILRGEAEDTACAENVVNKYKLTYDQLKERLL
ncbi:MAG: hypothetical protein K6G45_12775 [Lachnospiraceae bacterium]|nr:hypothetical protein [Lachnospiraceae bacterium]